MFLGNVVTSTRDRELVVTGPKCSGKTTVVEGVIDRHEAWDSSVGKMTTPEIRDRFLADLSIVIQPGLSDVPDCKRM